MYVAELTLPGSFIRVPDDEDGRRLQLLILHLQDQVSEMAVSLNLFLEARQVSLPDSAQARAEFLRKMQTQSEVRSARWQAYWSQVAAKMPYAPLPEICREADARLEADLRREAWRAGEVPEQYKRLPLFIYAKNFLFCLDNIKNLVRRIAENPHCPREVESTRDKIMAEFPDLKGLRDSAHHMEDRGQGLRRGKRGGLELISRNGNPLALGNIGSDVYFSSKEDGEIGGIEVSVASAEKFRSYVQQVLERFSWDGSQSFWP